MRPELNVYYEDTYRIDSRAVDPFGQCRPSALLEILQEAATSAACELHVSRDEMLAAYNVFWMLVRVWYRLDRPLHWDEGLTVRTWHRGGRGAAMYRDFDLFVDGVQVGEAVSTWVLADIGTRKLFQLSKVMEFEGTTGGALCKDRTLHRVRLPKDLPLVEKRRLHYSDCDVNGHVNNARYADLVCDAVDLGTAGKGRFVSSLQVGYLAECRAGETLDIHTSEADGTWYVRGCGDGGEARFDAALELTLDRGADQA